MFNRKIHYKWPFSIAMLNCQRVETVCHVALFWSFHWENHGMCVCDFSSRCVDMLWCPNSTVCRWFTTIRLFTWAFELSQHVLRMSAWWVVDHSCYRSLGRAAKNHVICIVLSCWSIFWVCTLAVHSGLPCFVVHEGAKPSGPERMVQNPADESRAVTHISIRTSGCLNSMSPQKVGPHGLGEGPNRVDWAARLQSNIVEVVLGRNDSVLPLLGKANQALTQVGTGTWGNASRDCFWAYQPLQGLPSMLEHSKTCTICTINYR